MAADIAPAGGRKVVLVTGATGGICTAIACKVGEAGHALALAYRSNQRAADRLASLLVEAGTPAATFRADLEDPAAAARLPCDVVDALGSLDAVVNGAGIVDDGPLLSFDPARYERILATNLFAVMHLIDAAIPFLARSGRAAIVNIASHAGIVGKEGQVAYAASKEGLIGLTRLLAKELAPLGIAVNAVAPAFIRTEMMAGLTDDMIDHVVQGSALARVGEAHEVASVVGFLLSPGYVQGATIRIDGGFHR